MRDGNETRRRHDLAKLAEGQHGAVSLSQLEGIGHTRSDVFRRTRGGSLRRTFPGVYRIAGAKQTLEQRVWRVTWSDLTIPSSG